jgi:maltooligosyltrehalose trehalohydrolase
VNLPAGAVWAPHVRSVDLVADGERVALERDERGIWGLERDGLAPGTTYWFCLDGGDERLADPRSRWQPEGPEGPSRVDDPGAFEWDDDAFEPEPWSRAVLYELHVGTFSPAGTFLGAIDHLDHLVELGVTHVELMPIGAWVGRWGWGYDGVCWWAPHAPYGTPDELRQLVAACHRRGLAVALDVVFNHLGPVGAQLDRFGPYTVDAPTPWGRAVNLDGPDSGPVRDHIVECGLMWLRDHHVDGLRLDAVHALADSSPRHLVAELTAAVDDLSVDIGRDLVVVAEWDRHDPRPVRDRRDGGWGCRAHWADDLHHALHVTLTGESAGYYADAAASPDPVREALERVYVPRRATGDPAAELSADGISRSAFVVCLQNHDQVGNRAAGERIAQIAPAGAALAAAAVTLLGPAVPLIFQGEEWAASSPFPYFAQHDGDLAAAVAEGRRAEFPDLPWEDVADPGATETFESATLRWDERDAAAHREAHRWYRTLLQLRAEHGALSAGAPCEVSRRGGATGALVLERGPFQIAVNLSPERVVVAARGAVAASWGTVDEGGLGPWAARICRS